MIDSPGPTNPLDHIDEKNENFSTFAGSSSTKVKFAASMTVII